MTHPTPQDVDAYISAAPEAARPELDPARSNKRFSCPSAIHGAGIPIGVWQWRDAATDPQLRG
jgi:hypothetical protein